MEKGAPPPYSAQQAPPAGFIQPPSHLPPPGHHMPMQTTVVVTGHPTLVGPFGPESQTTSCPYCHHQISTRVESEAATKTHLFALLLCLFGCWPCCCIPYCVDSCQNRNHYCPSCNAFLGAYTN